MFRNWRDLELLYDDMKYRPRKDRAIFEVDDYVKKVTGEYHVSGYIVAVFRTRTTRALRYVVEIRAEGGGSFLHIYASSNLQLIEKRQTVSELPLFEPLNSDEEAQLRRFRSS